MSLILEALRKSEAERRRGQSPDLYAELPPPSRRTARRVLPWQWLLLAAATLAIAGWAARGYLIANPEGSANAATVGPREIADTGRVAPTAIPLSSPSPVRTALDPMPSANGAVASAPRATPTAPPAVAKSTIQAAPPPDAAMAAPTMPAPTMPAPTTAPTRPAPALPAPPVAEPPSVAASSVLPAPRDAIASMPAPALRSEAPAEPANPTRTEPLPAPAAAAPVRLSDLSTAERQQLPPLKMSMHMWGQGPTQRFAIIDGTRVTEGDRIGEAVVDEISSDGVVLSWNGLHVKLPVR